MNSVFPVLSRLLLAATALALAPDARAQHLYNTPEITAFEDVPSAGGDEDHNDLVVRQRSRCDVERDGTDVVRQVIRFTAVAAGANLSNQLVLRLPAPGSVTIERGTDPAETLTPDASDEVVLYSDFRDAFAGTAEGFVNTGDGAVIEGRPTRVEILFDTPQAFGGCPLPRFELHRPDAGVVIDETTSVGSNDRPLAGTFPDGWAVPGEQVGIGLAYPGFLDWASDLADDGTCDTACGGTMWYESPDPGLVVDRPSLATTAPTPELPSCFDGTLNGDEEATDCGGLVCDCCSGERSVSGVCEVCGGDGILEEAPQAFWRLGETSGSTAVDATGNGWDAAYSSVTRGVSGALADGDPAVSFAGTTSSYVAAPSTLPFPTTGWGFSLWLRTTQGTRTGIVSYASSLSDNDVLLINPSFLEIYIRGGSYDVGVDVADGAWHHVVFTRRASDGRTSVYVDGTRRYMVDHSPGAAHGSGGRLFLAQEQDSVGGGFTSGQAYQGDLDDVALFDRFLYDSDVSSIYASTACP